MKMSPAGIAGIILVIVLVGIVILFALPNSPDSDVPNGTYDSFAQCITQAGAKMYGAFWCPHCNDQKASFGSGWQYVTYIECSTPDGTDQLPVCAAAGISGYPTWVFADGSRIEGIASFPQLAAKTSCTLP